MPPVRWTDLKKNWDMEGENRDNRNYQKAIRAIRFAKHPSRYQSALLPKTAVLTHILEQTQK